MTRCPTCGHDTSPRPAVGLTHRQRQLMDYIAAYTATHGFSPNYREAADHIGITSMSGVNCLVKALVERGHLTHIPYRRRSLALVHGGVTDADSQMSVTHAVIEDAAMADVNGIARVRHSLGKGLGRKGAIFAAMMTDGRLHTMGEMRDAMGPHGYSTSVESIRVMIYRLRDAGLKINCISSVGYMMTNDACVFVKAIMAGTEQSGVTLPGAPAQAVGDASPAKPSPTAALVQKRPDGTYDKAAYLGSG